MNLEDFIETVRKLRQHQKAYFKDRKQSDLIEARKLEKHVDRALEEGIIIPILDTRPDPRPEPTKPAPAQFDLFE